MKETQVISGVWKLSGNGNAINGMLRYNDEAGYLSLELIVASTEEDPEPDFPFIGRIPFIVGHLYTGGYITLYDCSTGNGRTIVNSATRLMVYAKYAFWGLKANSIEDLTFKGVSVDFGDILNWYELCHFEQTRPIANSIGNFHWESKEPVVINCNKNLNVHFLPVTQFFAGKNFKRECTLNQNVTVNFEYMNSVSWETVLDDIRSFEYLIGLGINDIVEPDKIKYKHDSICIEMDNGLRFLTDADVLIGTGKKQTQKNRRPYEFLFSFQDFQNIHDGYNKWNASYEKMKPALDLMFAVYRGVGTPEIEFLCLIQALETLHSRFYAKTIGEYKVRVDVLMSMIENEEQKKVWYGYLYEKWQNQAKGILLLKSRLYDLFYAEGEFPIMLGGDQLANYIQKLSDTRNYYTHYDENKQRLSFSRAELPYVNSYLICLLEYHLLCIVGFSKEFVGDKIRSICNAIRFSQNNSLPKDV